MESPDSKKQRLWVWWLVFILLVATIIYFAFKLTGHEKILQAAQPGLYRIVKFDDGDTITVDMNGQPETVRMIGVDTPETQHPERPVECYGREAAEYTKGLIGDQRVRLQADPLDTNRDRYGRLLRYVYMPDNTLIQQKLLMEGYGFAYTFFPFTKTIEFSDYEQQAKASGKGLWAACQIEIEANGARHTNAL